MTDCIRYRKKKSAHVLPYNPWNLDAEPGDIMVRHDGIVYRLEDQKGTQKSRAGELYPRLIRPPQSNMIGKIIDGELWWVNKEEKP